MSRHVTKMDVEIDNLDKFTLNFCLSCDLVMVTRDSILEFQSEYKRRFPFPFASVNMNDDIDNFISFEKKMGQICSEISIDLPSLQKNKMSVKSEHEEIEIQRSKIHTQIINLTKQHNALSAQQNEITIKHDQLHHKCEDLTKYYNRIVRLINKYHDVRDQLDRNTEMFHHHQTQIDSHKNKLIRYFEQKWYSLFFSVFFSLSLSSLT